MGMPIFCFFSRRNRMIFGSLCFLAAMGFLFWGFMLPEDFAIRNYFLSTFGTYTPNETMIQLGMSPTVSPRAVGVTPIFALPTYEQWLILQKINSFAVTFALGIIFFYFKKIKFLKSKYYSKNITWKCFYCSII